MKKKKTQEITINLRTVNACLVVILIVILLASLYAVTQINKMLAEAEPVTPEVAKLKLTTITADCEDCFDISQAAALATATPNTEFEEASLSMEEAKDLIEKYSVAKLPALVITGETEGVTIQAFESRDDALVFDQTPAPYYDVETSSIKGLVKVTLVADSDCEDCVDVSLMVNQLNQFGVKIVEEKTVEFDSAEGKELIEKYSIEKIPTIIFSKDALDYDLISEVWDQVGTTEDDALVLRTVTPPYIDVATGELVGIVDFTYLTDDTCSECYDVTTLKDVMAQNFGMKVGKETTIDINTDEGKELVEKYKITKVPTVILSSAAEDYPAIGQVWSQIGSVADDGSYVFEKIELMQGSVYKDLETGKVVGKAAETATTAEATTTTETTSETAATEETEPEETTEESEEQSAVIVESGSE